MNSLVVSQSVGIVAPNSYIVIVNPEKLVKQTPRRREERVGRTIGLVVILHVQERVIVNVAVEVYVGPMDQIKSRSAPRNSPARRVLRPHTLPASTTCTFAAPDGGRRTTADRERWISALAMTPRQ